MEESVNFKFGERKRVKIKIESICEAPFVITNAKYTLICGDEIEDSGICEIIQTCELSSVLSALVNPLKNKAIYTLRFDYNIDQEHLIHDVLIRTI